ncbi:Zinc finger, FYVE/PHD-type [Pseudocohnilembus persalinus]|uniref:Zinc finger, FYVE/PHD-type n=1 Tax=Pseudocohnilembus persalinus TaxID=266149 RepID=A0A0V0R3Y6_PSEPJ|nr:Zinc finger, FYVE/PHD-type [Pseudocohnilembus persalinus]|eukprot:KRX09098.1 Zinc finger, FYVE/PHD-type [Pseudocohnilembus persalinus]
MSEYFSDEDSQQFKKKKTNKRRAAKIYSDSDEDAFDEQYQKEMQQENNISEEEEDYKNNRRQRNNKKQDSYSFLDEDDEFMEEEVEQGDEEFYNYETDNNEEICFICKEQGNLLCCENCFRSYHLSCINMKKVPNGLWECSFCNEDERQQCSYCDKICEKQDKTCMCSLCFKFCHIECTGLPSYQIADNPMNRQIFLNHEISIMLDKVKTHDTKENIENFEKALEELREQKKGKTDLFQICKNCQQYNGIEKILDSQGGEEPETQNYLVKFENASFMNCYWLTYEQVEKIGARKLKNFVDKQKKKKEKGDVDTYTEDLMEELEDYTKIERIVECKRPLKLCKMQYKEIYDTFFSTEEKSEQHLENISFGSKHNIKFYIKWKSLNYDRCTWEDEYIVSRYPELLKKFIGNKVIEENLGNPSLFKEMRQELKKITFNKYEDKMNKKQPKYITGGCLHSFQLYGVKWISDSYNKGNNVILADEMGLGKTIQTLSFLNYLFYEKDIDGPFLVVVPATTMYNWHKETEVWASKMNVIVYMGNPDAREQMRNTDFYFKVRSDNKGKVKNNIPKFHVLITSYDTVINDIAYLRKFNWESMVVDEAHRLKNNESKFFRIAQTLKTKHKLLLTGTPLQNNIVELINLIEFICPQKAKSLKSYDSLKIFLNSQAHITKEQQENITEEDKKQGLSELTEVLQPHLLRRKKGDVDIQLPEMEEIIVKLALTDNQKYYYKNVLVKNYDNLKILDTKSKQISKFSLLNILMNLRLICNHPYLFLYKKKYDLPTKENFMQEFVNNSNKLKFLCRVLPKLLQGNHKILIFSQFVMMLDILGDYLSYMQTSFERLDGQTSVVDRQRIIDQFNDKGSKSNVFLLSTRAGGLGINLTSADTIFFIDSDFNPYRDVQAISRAHRMGQVSKVKVYRLVSKYSAEEKIIEVATKKLLLESIIINPINKFTKDDFESILQQGSYEMFNKNLEQKDKDFTDEQIDVLLARDDVKGDKQMDNVQLTKNDINDYYLSGFKFTSLNFETVTDKQQENENINVEQKQKYWETLLDDEANQLMEKQNETLGKGKRVRRQLQQTTIDDSRSLSPGSNYSEDKEKKEIENSSDEELQGLVQEKALVKNMLKEKKDKKIRDREKESRPSKENKETKEVQLQIQRQKQKTLKITQKLMNYFQEEVFYNSQVIDASLKDKDKLRYVLHGFDHNHRLQFLTFVMQFGTEFDNLQEFFNELCRQRPEYFNQNDKIPPSFNDFRNYLKEFYAAILFHQQLDQHNAMFCGIEPKGLLRRLSSLNFLSKKYQFFNKGKPEKFRISHKDYFKYQIEINAQNQPKNNDFKWTNYDDFLLCRAIFSKGYGNWEAMIDDEKLWNFVDPQDKEPWMVLFQKLDENQERNFDNINKQKAREWVQIRLRNRTCNMMNWLLELDEAKQEEN